MANPNTMEASNSFILTTLTPMQQRIDTAISGFVIKMQEPADLTVQEFDVRKQTVG